MNDVEHVDNELNTDKKRNDATPPSNAELVEIELATLALVAGGPGSWESS